MLLDTEIQLNVLQVFLCRNKHPEKSIMELVYQTSTVKKKTKISDWVSPSFQELEFSAPKPKKCKLSSYKSAVVQPAPGSCEMWVKKYAPQNVEELAVHQKKVCDVETWIVNHLSCNHVGAPILVLTGPPGCGKTATLMVVAKKHGIEVEEWSNPLTTPYFVSKQAGLWSDSQNTQFEEFLFRSGRYTSVISGNIENMHHKLILLEDLPNFLYLTPSYLKNVLYRYKKTQRNPLVLIISDERSSDSIKRQVISVDFQNSTGINCVKFNAISATLLSKAVRRIIAAEKLLLNKEEVAELSNEYAGDIRAAINALQFLSHSDTLGLLSNRQSTGKQGEHVVKGKDANIFLFRALGKVLYCKRENVDKPQLSAIPTDKYRDPLAIQPEVVLDQCCLSGSAFGLFLHHNYLSVFENNSLSDVVLASEYFSFSDLINSRITASDPSSGAASFLDKYEGVVATRGLLYSNNLRATTALCSKATGMWRPLHKPTWYKVNKERLDSCASVSSSFWKYRQGPEDLLCSTLPYLTRLKDHAKCDPAQVLLLNNIVNLPKWKLFHSHMGNEKVTEYLTDDDSNLSLETTCKEVKVNDNYEDEEIVIEDFSD